MNDIWLRVNYDDERCEEYNVIQFNIYKNLNYILITQYNEELKANTRRPIYLNNVDYIEVYKDGICEKIIDIKEVK